MIQNVTLAQSRIDNIRLNAQRQEKQRKDEFVLQANLSKASKDCVEVLLQQDKCINGVFCTSKEEANSEIKKIKGIRAKRKILQDEITNCAKGFG